MIVALQGRLVASGDARVSVLDRGFVHGDGALETLAVVQGRPVWLEAHLTRLAHTLELLRIPVSLDEVRDDVARVCSAVGAEDGILRAIVTRGVGALGPRVVPTSEPTRVVIFVAAPVALMGASVGDARLAVVEWPATWAGSAGAKMPAYAAQIVARGVAVAQGADDALLVNERGAVVEATTSCIVARDRSGVLVTPPRADGPLESITGRHVLELAAGMGWPTAQRSLPLSELRASCDAALASSVTGLLRVASLDGCPAAGDGGWVRELAARLRDSVVRDTNRPAGP